MFWRILSLPDGSTFFIRIFNGIVGDPYTSMAFWIIAFIGLIMAITIHEFAHAYSAHLLGDDTAKYSDRMNLNPTKHFDALGFFMILLTPFGYGKPVPVNPNNFVNPVQGLMYVSLAGPMSNLLQAALFGILYIVLRQIPPSEGLLTTFTYTLPFLGMINISLMIFNLLPIYPLDGSKIWGYLHYKIDDFINQYITPYALIYIIILIFPLFGSTSILGLILDPISRIYLSLLR
jgi:Zn-dependent protease